MHSKSQITGTTVILTGVETDNPPLYQDVLDLDIRFRN